MSCAGKCALCCCCGPGQLIDLPDYYCRFYSSLPVMGGFNYGCNDTSRKYLNWLLTEQQSDGSNTNLALNADNMFAYDPRDAFVDEENTTCYMSYGTSLSPYSYGDFCFQNGTYESTDWTEIERIQNRCTGQGSSGYVCFRKQTWARISWDLTNPKVFIARCKVPTDGCKEETDVRQEGLNVGQCGYLVIATVDVCYKIETRTVLMQSDPNAACSTLPDFYDEPTGTIVVVEQGTVCVTRSRVVRTLKDNASLPDAIWIELEINDQVPTCCHDWLMPENFNQEYRDSLFRCGCDTEASFSISGECPDLTNQPCDQADTICEVATLTVPYAAGSSWRLTSSA